VSEVDQAAVRADFWEIFDIDDDIAPGEPAVAEARRRARVRLDLGQARTRARSPA
jgi:hypothetical protein